MNSTIKKHILFVIKREVGEKVEIVETRKDPKVQGTYAVRTKNHGCFLICQTIEEGFEVLDTFDLEEGQKSLKSIPTGELKFF